MSERATKRLGDLISIKHGYAFKGEYFSDNEPGPILLTPGNFAIGGGFKESKPKYYLGPIPGEFRLKSGDLVVTMTDLSKAGDTLGYPAIIPAGSDYLHNQRIGLISVKSPDIIDKLFLFYALRTLNYHSHVLAGATGSTVRHTSPSRISEYEVSIPSLGMQRGIATMLGALDAKIAVNDRIVTATHDLAQAHSVRVHATAALSNLSKLADITMGSSPPGESYNEDGLGMPFYQGARDFGNRFPSRRVWCTSPVRIASQGACLVSVRAPVGRVNIARERCCIGRGVAAMLSKQNTPSVLFHEIVAARDMWLPFEAEGTVFGAINKQQLADIEIPALDTESARDLEEILGPLDQRVMSACDENQALGALRDALLPRLMSGEIRVRDAEKVVEDVT